MRPIAAEAEHIVASRAAPSIDGLVVVRGSEEARPSAAESFPGGGRRGDRQGRRSVGLLPRVGLPCMLPRGRTGEAEEPRVLDGGGVLSGRAREASAQAASAQRVRVCARPRVRACGVPPRLRVWRGAASARVGGGVGGGGRWAPSEGAHPLTWSSSTTT